MDEATITRIVTLLFGIVAFAISGVLTYLLNLFRKSMEGFVREVHTNTENQEHMDKCLDDLKKIVREELIPAVNNTQVEQQIRMVEYWKLREEFAHFRGMAGFALHEPADLSEAPDSRRDLAS